MAQLRIPEPIKRGLLRIASLTDEQFQELSSALENLPLRINQRTIFDYAGIRTETIPSDELAYIQDALFPIYIAQSRPDTLALSYVDDIVESLQEVERDLEETISKLKERLTHLLSIQKPKLIAKANEILIGQKPAYSNGRILSDIRPIFTEKIEESPSAAVIVHMLRITYYQDTTEREFVVALDTKDIQQLMDTLERAKKKTQTLQSVISSASMNFIDIV